MSPTIEDMPSTWDPMKEDYEDSRFNAFLKGPGQSLSNHAGNKREKFSDIQICVEDIPKDLTNDGLFNIFSQYGEMEVAYRRKSNFNEHGVAYIRFKTQIAANRAIKELDQAAPFFLRVKYSKAKERKVFSDEVIPFHSIADEKLYFPEKREKPKNIYHGATVEQIQSKFFSTKAKMTFICNDNFDPLYCNLFVNYHDDENKIYSCLNDVYIKKLKSKDISVYKGCRYYKEQQTQIKKLSHFEFGQGRKSLISNTGCCGFCGSEASHACKSCSQVYCSRKCQVQDWSRHKEQCSPKRNSPVSTCDLKVTHVDEDFLYAIKVENLNKFLELKKRMQEVCPTELRFWVFKNKKCAVFDDERNEWCRGTYAGYSSSSSLKIYFCDYGFTKSCLPSSTKWLIADFDQDEPFAVKVKLSSSNYDSVSVGDVIKVSSMVTTDGFCKAILEEICNNRTKSVQPEVLESSKDCSQLSLLDKSDVLPSSIIKHFETDEKASLSIGCVVRRDAFTACLVSSNQTENCKILGTCGHMLFDVFQKEMAEWDENIKFIPKTGDLVAVYDEKENMWSRGIVWSVFKSTFVRCALIDLGHIVSVRLKHVQPLHKKYSGLPSLGVYCKVTNIKSKEAFEKMLLSGCSYFTVENKSSKTMILNVVDQTRKRVVCNLEVSSWRPTNEEIGIKAVELSSNNLVRLTHFCNDKIFYVSPANDMNFTISQKLIQLISESQPMNRTPRFGELVAIRWDKSNQFGRAQVFESCGKKEYRIFFIDSGVQEIQKLGDLYELNDELKSLPGLAVKICLKGIARDVITNLSIIDYLNSLAVNEQILKITMEKNDLSAAELHLFNNETVNDKINQFYKLESKKCDDFDDEFYSSEIIYHELKLNENIEVGLLNEVQGGYMMIETKANSVQFVFKVLQKLMNQYCNSLTNDAYYPRVNEVCFAEYTSNETQKKNWCRAIVLDNAHLGSSVVSFIDTGAIGDILHSSIRKMNRKFMVVPAAATVVTVNFPKELTTSMLADVLTFFRDFATYTCSVKSNVEDFHYTADFPILADILKYFGHKL